MRTRGAVAVLALVGATFVTLPTSAADQTVEIFNNFYSPQQVAVDVGDTVTWSAVDPGHTVSPDDGRPGCGTNAILNAGEQATCTFTDDETFYYHCDVHAGMFGVITVGEGTPLPPPGGPSETLTVCDGCGEVGKYDTIGAALGIAKPRALIQIEPGSYDEFLTVSKPGIELRGLGASPGDVTLTPATAQLAVIVLGGADQIVRNLSVSGGQIAGIEVVGADDATIDRVTLTSNGRYGVWSHDSHGTWVSDSSATGHSYGGFGATDCPACDVVFDGVSASGNFTGVYVEDAGSVVVKDSTLTANGAGVVLRSTWIEGEGIDADAPQAASHIIGNTITGNVAMLTPKPPISAEMPLRSGAGVWISAGSFNVVEHNAIDDHLYGVVVTGLIGPSLMNRVTDNTVSGSHAADVAWDGVGVSTCFARNARPGGADVTTEPPLAQTIYDCGLPATVGVPYPPVAITLADWATI